MSELTDLIGQCASDMAGDDVVKIAHNVAEATADFKLREFYTEALTPLVRITLGNQRNRAAADVRRGRTRSLKTEAMRSAWDRFLDSFTAVGNGEYKRLRDVTVADLHTIIETRQNHIASVQQQVAHYERIKAAMITQGATTIGDLRGAVE